MANASYVTIEVDGPKNESLVFRPLVGHRIRGRFDVKRISEPESGRLAKRWPEPVPGQRLRLSPAVEGKERHDIGDLTVIEPLHAEEHALNKKRVLASGQAIAPAEVNHQVEISSALHYMKQAVDTGLARVVEGELPKTLKHKPRTQYHTREVEHREDKVEAAIGKMASAIETIAAQSQTQQAALQAILERVAASRN
jgi:hypothetical protein